MGHRPHLYLPGPWQGETVHLNGQQLSHLRKSLRIADPSDVTYTDGVGASGSGVFDGVKVRRGDEVTTPRPSVLTVAVAPPRAKERQRFLVEKLQELGVGSLAWLRTKHGIGAAPPEKRMTAWAIGALEQSRGAWLMQMAGDTSLEDYDSSRSVICDRDGDASPPPETSIVAVGPEGGWAPGEIVPEIPTWSLGPTVLRVETAAIVAAARLIKR